MREERTTSLFVCTQMEAGGAQVLAISMQQALLSEGQDSSVVFLYEKRPVFNNLCGVSSLFRGRPSGLSYLRIIWRLYKHIKEVRPSAIVGMAHYSSPLACIFGLLCGVPARVATQTSPVGSVNRFARGIDWLCGTMGVYTTNIAASRSIKDGFSGFPTAYRERLTTVYNGVSIKAAATSKGDAREFFRLDPNAFLLVTCGRLAPVKNHVMLLDVIENLPTGVRLAILGDGELRGMLGKEILRRGLVDRVVLLGEVSRDLVPIFLAAGDLFVFPSRYEAFGVAAVEAMQVGLPIVASDHPGISEVVGEAGVFADCDDVDGWVNAISLIRSDAALLEAMALQSKARGAEFGFDAMLRGFKEKMGI